jgi:hypothetical protein
MPQSESSTIHRLSTLAQLSELVGVPRGRIRAWVRAGLVQPAAKANGELQFDFRQITAVKTLAKLTQAGVKISRLCQRGTAHVADLLTPGAPRAVGGVCDEEARSLEHAILVVS